MQSNDKLFFVSFRPEGTLRARWYLVSVDLDQTALITKQHGNPAQSDVYHVHFFTRHPADSNESDPLARWWPEWREYSTGNDGVIDYGIRVLFPPTQTPNADRYIAWADVVNLSNPTACLLGSFEFMEPCHNYAGRSPSYRQYVPTEVGLSWRNYVYRTVSFHPVLRFLGCLKETERSADKRKPPLQHP
jgi:hypothetical protein